MTRTAWPLSLVIPCPAISNGAAEGHIEKGETPQQTAVREVHEETGILGEVIDSIATIDYWFTGTTQRVAKLVHHLGAQTDRR